MLKNYLKSFGVFALITLTYNCSNDDKDSYIPILIEANADIAEVTQNSTVTIDVLSNDTNVPLIGTLSAETPTNGSVEVLDLNETPNDPSDDQLRYIPNTDFYGTDEFQYTICDIFNSCATATVSISINPVSTVVFNLDEVPYATLSEYNFFTGDIKELNPAYSVLPYDLISPLFSDYAHKERFVWMPDGSKANYNTDFTTLDFPVGAVLIKNFYYNNVLPLNTTKIIETRLMYMTPDGWDFANYLWNEEQTEATFTESGHIIDFSWIEDGQTTDINYKVPSRAACFTCHNKFGTPVPIGPKPQNLNKDMTYGEESINQLQKWINYGYLEDNLPTSIVTTVKWDDESQDLNLRARSYLDINCAHCHSDESYCEYRPMRFAFNDSEDNANKGVCVTPNTQILGMTHIVTPGNTATSVMRFRINSVEEQFRMPIIGRTLRHEQGVRLIEEWINSLSGECE